MKKSYAAGFSPTDDWLPRELQSDLTFFVCFLYYIQIIVLLGRASWWLKFCLLQKANQMHQQEATCCWYWSFFINWILIKLSPHFFILSPKLSLSTVQNHHILKRILVLILSILIFLFSIILLYFTLLTKRLLYWLVVLFYSFRSIVLWWCTVLKQEWLIVRW